MTTMPGAHALLQLAGLLLFHHSKSVEARAFAGTSAAHVPQHSSRSGCSAAVSGGTRRGRPASLPGTRPKQQTPRQTPRSLRRACLHVVFELLDLGTLCILDGTCTALHRPLAPLHVPWFALAPTCGAIRAPLFSWVKEHEAVDKVNWHLQGGASTGADVWYMSGRRTQPWQHPPFHDPIPPPHPLTSTSSARSLSSSAAKWPSAASADGPRTTTSARTISSGNSIHFGRHNAVVPCGRRAHSAACECAGVCKLASAPCPVSVLQEARCTRGGAGECRGQGRHHTCTDASTCTVQPSPALKGMGPGKNESGRLLVSTSCRTVMPVRPIGCGGRELHGHEGRQGMPAEARLKAKGVHAPAAWAWPLTLL